MNYLKKIFLLFFVLLLSACSDSKIITDTNLNKTETIDQNLPVIALQEMFYEANSFNKAILQAEKITSKKDIGSIVVPHHLLASTYIANLIKMSVGRKIKTVVIVGPNHENIGTNPVTTAQVQWNTPRGLILTDQKLVTSFMSDFKISSQEQVFFKEHSVGAIIPFVKYYLPDAKILPIVFSSYSETREVEQVGEWLSKNLPADSLIIFSMDFSHYLTKAEADNNDKITEQLIKDRGVGRIIKLNNDYVDSPASLATSLLFAKKKNLKTSIIYNSNSFDFSIKKPIETTSYFGMVFAMEDYSGLRSREIE